MTDAFAALLEGAQQAFADAKVEEALQLFREAEKTAREAGDADRADRAFCQRCFVLVQSDGLTDEVARLKALYLQSADQTNRWSASYVIADAYHDVGDSIPAEEWALRAAALADRLGVPRLRFRSYNLLGAITLRRGEFSDAERCFLNLDTELVGPEITPESRAVARANLGYVFMCTDRLSEGIALCEDACHELEPCEHYLYECLQDLCYGYILADDLERAERCGRHALALAQKFSDALIVKNCLFLLSEVAVRRGDTFRARRLLRELTAFYAHVGQPEEIIEVFLQTDLTAVVNLRG